MYETSPSATRPRDDLLGAYCALDTNSAGLIADQVLPPFQVAQEDGMYSVIPREAYLQRVDTKRAIGAPAASSDWSPDSDTFSLANYAFKSPAFERAAKIYGSFMRVQDIEARRCALKIALDREIDTAAAVFNTTTFGTNNVNTFTIAGGSEWDVSTGAGKPVTDIMTARTMHVENGFGEPNALIISFYLLARLGLCTQIRDFLGDQVDQPGLLPLPTLQGIFGLEKIIVAKGIYNSARAGQTPVWSRIWSNDYAMVCRIEDSDDIETPQLGRTLRLMDKEPTLESYVIPDPKGEMVVADDIAAPKLMKTPAGVLIRNTAA